MKKLNKLEKGFAALENKELSNLEQVMGGVQTQTIKHRQATHDGEWSDTTNTTDSGTVYTVYSYVY